MLKHNHEWYYYSMAGQVRIDFQDTFYDVLPCPFYASRADVRSKNYEYYLGLGACQQLHGFRQGVNGKRLVGYWV